MLKVEIKKKKKKKKIVLLEGQIEKKNQLKMIKKKTELTH